jgi:hypothetical protein
MRTGNYATHDRAFGAFPAREIGNAISNLSQFRLRSHPNLGNMKGVQTRIDKEGCDEVLVCSFAS